MIGIIRYINLMSIDQKTPLLVTGLSGMVGSRFGQLFGHKYKLHGLDLSCGVDITEPSQVSKMIKESAATSVIHLAAFTNVSAAHEQNGDVDGSCYQVNVAGTRNVAEACRENSKYLIHISTDFVFDGVNASEYLETDSPHPIEWYGMTKLLAEQVVESTLSDYLILRIAYPYQTNPNRPDFLKNMMDKMNSGTLPPQFTDHTITPTFVDDVARVLDYSLINRPKGLYHAVGSSSHTDYELAQAVKTVFAFDAEIKPGDLDSYLKLVNRPYQRHLRVSNAKLTRDFGIKLNTFSEGLREIKRQRAMCK
jgi:dTDP-4-dehydrorhamnose reductase